MIPAHFHKMILAEMSLVFGRWSGRVALGFAVLVPIITVLVLNYADEKTMQVFNYFWRPQCTDMRLPLRQITWIAKKAGAWQKQRRSITNDSRKLKLRCNAI